MCQIRVSVFIDGSLCVGGWLYIGGVLHLLPLGVTEGMQYAVCVVCQIGVR